MIYDLLINARDLKSIIQIHPWSLPSTLKRTHVFSDGYRIWILRAEDGLLKFSLILSRAPLLNGPEKSEIPPQRQNQYRLAMLMAIGERSKPAWNEVPPP